MSLGKLNIEWCGEDRKKTIPLWSMPGMALWPEPGVLGPAQMFAQAQSDHGLCCLWHASWGENTETDIISSNVGE